MQRKKANQQRQCAALGNDVLGGVRSCQTTHMLLWHFSLPPEACIFINFPMVKGHWMFGLLAGSKFSCFQSENSWGYSLVAFGIIIRLPKHCWTEPFNWRMVTIFTELHLTPLVELWHVSISASWRRQDQTSTHLESWNLDLRPPRQVFKLHVCSSETRLEKTTCLFFCINTYKIQYKHFNWQILYNTLSNKRQN